MITQQIIIRGTTDVNENSKRKDLIHTIDSRNRSFNIEDVTIKQRLCAYTK